MSGEPARDDRPVPAQHGREHQQGDAHASPDNQSITDLAEQVQEDTDDPAVETLAKATKQLAIEHSRLDDYVRVLIDDRINDVEASVDDHDAQIAGLKATQQDHDRQLESFLGPTPGRSGREKRLADIRTAMIRAGQANGKGIKKHRYDIEELLAEHGYSREQIPSKPQLRKDIDDLAGEDGFYETTKPREGKDGVVRDVKALKVVVAELPENRVSNQVTTEKSATGRDQQSNETTTR